MDNYSLEELKQIVLNEIFELEDLLVTRGDDARYYRLYGKREAFKMVFDEINKLIGN